MFFKVLIEVWPSLLLISLVGVLAKPPGLNLEPDDLIVVPKTTTSNPAKVDWQSDPEVKGLMNLLTDPKAEDIDVSQVPVHLDSLGGHLLLKPELTIPKISKYIDGFLNLSETSVFKCNRQLIPNQKAIYNFMHTNLDEQSNLGRYLIHYNEKQFKVCLQYYEKELVDNLTFMSSNQPELIPIMKFLGTQQPGIIANGSSLVDRRIDALATYIKENIDIQPLLNLKDSQEQRELLKAHFDRLIREPCKSIGQQMYEITQMVNLIQRASKTNLKETLTPNMVKWIRIFEVNRYINNYHIFDQLFNYILNDSRDQRKRLKFIDLQSISKPTKVPDSSESSKETLLGQLLYNN